MLQATRYSDGKPILLVNSSSSWNALKDTTKAYCWHNDDPGNKNVYGALYTWAAAMNGASYSVKVPSGIKGVCPTGWHIPSLAEWNQLVTFLGGKEIAGGKMKEAGTTHWVSPNVAATNESGFSGLPGSSRPWFGFLVLKQDTLVTGGVQIFRVSALLTRHGVSTCQEGTVI